MDWQRRLQIIIRWALVGTVVYAVAMGVYVLAHGSVPTVDAPRDLAVAARWLDITGPVSRWWDVLLGTMWAAIIAFVLTERHFLNWLAHANDDIDAVGVVGGGLTIWLAIILVGTVAVGVEDLLADKPRTHEVASLLSISVFVVTLGIDRSLATACMAMINALVTTMVFESIGLGIIEGMESIGVTILTIGCAFAVLSLWEGAHMHALPGGLAALTGRALRALRDWLFSRPQQPQPPQEP